MGDCPSIISLLMPFRIYSQTLGYNLPSRFSSVQFNHLLITCYILGTGGWSNVKRKNTIKPNNQLWNSGWLRWHSLWFAVLCLVAQSCPWTEVCHPSATPWTEVCQALLSMGILQARILEWAAMYSSRGSSQSRDGTQVTCIAGGFFTGWATREAPFLPREVHKDRLALSMVLSTVDEHVLLCFVLL